MIYLKNIKIAVFFIAFVVFFAVLSPSPALSVEYYKCSCVAPEKLNDSGDCENPVPTYTWDGWGTKTIWFKKGKNNIENFDLAFSKPEDCEKGGMIMNTFENLVNQNVLCFQSCQLEKCASGGEGGSIQNCEKVCPLKWETNQATVELGSSQAFVLKTSGWKEGDKVKFSCDECGDGISISADDALGSATLKVDAKVAATEPKNLTAKLKAEYFQKDLVGMFGTDLDWKSCDAKIDFLVKIVNPDCGKLIPAGTDCEKELELCKTKCQDTNQYCFLSSDGTCKPKTQATTEEVNSWNAEQTKKYIMDTHQSPRKDGWQGALPDCAFSGTCRKANDLVELIVNFGKGMFAILGSFAFAYFVYGGFTIVVSMGNAEKVKKGQQILVAAVIGLVIAFSAYLLIDFMLDALDVMPDFRGIK